MGLTPARWNGTLLRRAILAAACAGVVAWLPAHALAQVTGDVSKAEAGPVPRLGQHRFSSTPLIRGPFIRTSLRENLGVGASDGLVLGTFAVGDTTIQIKSGELLYTDIMLEYQHAVKDWLAFSLQLGGGGRLGTETSSLIAEGVSVASMFEVGWRMRLWQSDDMMLSGGLSVNDRSYTLVDLAGFIDRIVEDGGLRPGNTLVRSVPIFMTLAELRYAWGVSDLVGLVAEASFGYGESVKREASSEWYHTLGAVVDFDLNPRTSVPVGIAIGMQVYNVPMGDPSVDGSATGVLLRLSHTGASDLDLGIAVESRWLDLTQIEGTLRYTSFVLDFEYFF